MIRVRTLGQCTIQIDTSHITPDAEIVFASLLLLTVERSRRVERSELLGMLWPDVSAARASHCLRQTIYRLRTLGAPLEVDRTQLVLSDHDLECDVDPLLRATRADDAEELADRVIGPFLPGYAPRFSEPLRDWVEHQRDRVNAGARRVLVSAIAARKARGEWVHVERLARQCLAIDPLNEEATLALAEAAALHGGKAEALGILDRYLREMGPTARELRLPAVVLRRRISEPECEFPLSPPLHVPFVGRGAEMAILTTALRNARGGAGSVHFIHGEPGIGKTRLLTEFTRVAALEGSRLALSHCQSSDSQRSLSAFVDLLPRLMVMPGAIGCSPQAHKYLRRLIDQQSIDVSSTSNTSEAALLYASVRQSLFDLLDAISSETLLTIGIEDAQWLDPASWEIVAEATAWLGSRRIVLIVTSRDQEPRYPPTAIPMAGTLHSLGLGALDRSARETLFVATLRDSRHGWTDAFREWCVNMSGGNPYYLAELALHGLDARGDFAVPPSLTALVAQRIARLRPVSCRVLQACAILGKNATLQRIQALLDEPCAKLLDGFDDLDAAGLLEARGEGIVARHDLLAQAATLRASRLSQQLLHRRTAEILQAEFQKTGVPALAWDSAEHWRQSGEAAKGIELAVGCARHSLHVGRPAEAVEILQCVLSWCPGDEARLRVMIDYAHALRSAERWQDLVDTLGKLLQPHRGLSPEARSGYRLELIEARWLAGNMPISTVEDLIAECSTGLAGPLQRVRAATLAIIAIDNVCVSDAAPRVERFARPLVESHGDELVSKDYELVFQCSYGDPDKAVDVATGLVETLRQGDTQPVLCKYLLRAAHVFEVAGRLDESISLACEAFEIAERFSLSASACLAARRLAWEYLELADAHQLAHWTAKGETWSTRAQHPASVADLATLRAEVALAHGDLAEAAYLFERSNALWVPLKHPRSEAHALAFKLALTVEAHRALLPADLDEACRLYKVLADRAMCDVVVARFALGLAAAGRIYESGEMIDTYLNRYRRERGAIRAFFRQLVERVRNEHGVRTHDSPLFDPHTSSPVRPLAECA
jgi:DNA-binding SARP family transcriptional activator/tetratricopeptide (TPR) repeat protein